MAKVCDECLAKAVRNGGPQLSAVMDPNSVKYERAKCWVCKADDDCAVVPLLIAMWKPEWIRQ